MKRHNPDDLVQFISALPDGKTVIITSPGTIPSNISISEYFSFLIKQGFSRVENDGIISRIDEPDACNKFIQGHNINIVIKYVELCHNIV